LRVAAGGLATTLLALGLAACNPVKPPPPEPPVISANPSLFPGFRVDVFDYVNRCTPGTPTAVQVDAPADTTVSVDGSPPAGGQFVVEVPQDVGERFAMDVTIGGNTTTHHVRCLPADFPNFTVQKNGPTQAEFYATALVQGFGPPNYGTLGLGPPRPPRNTRYAINTQNQTATLIQTLADGEVGSSGCCGSTRLLPDGNWVTGWGGTPQISEYAPDGTRLFRISGTFVYRGTPVLPGEFTAQQFRDGMDAQFANAASAQAAEPPANLDNSPLARTLASMQCCS
jgi:hypothetical protein